MDTLTYLNAVLPENGTKYCCATYDKLLPNGKVAPTLHALGSVQALYKTILFHAKKGVNVGIALASFKRGWHRDHTRNKNVFKVASNAESMKSIWMDIDIGDGKDYLKKVDAVRHLSAFLNATGLPKPMVVSSGAGLHIYWCLTESVPLEKWSPVANGLCLCAQHFGLKHDRLVLGKPASMLRPVGVLNVKHGKLVDTLTPQTAHSLESLDCTISSYMRAHQLTHVNQPQTDALSNAAFRSMMGGAIDWGKDKDPVRIVSGCRQIREAGIGGYDVWWSMMTVMDCCENGKHVAKKISQTSAKFDNQEFEAKWSNLDDRLGGGPALCSTFRAANPEGCDGCRWASTNLKTPATLGHYNRDLDDAAAIAFGRIV